MGISLSISYPPAPADVRDRWWLPSWILNPRVSWIRTMQFEIPARGWSPSWIVNPLILWFRTRQFGIPTRGNQREEGGADSPAAYHEFFMFLIIVLLTLTQMKFNGGIASLSKLHPKIAACFILTICIYVISQARLSRLDSATWNYSIIKYIAVLSGFTSFQLILTALVPVTALVAIDICLFLLILLVNMPPIRQQQEVLNMGYPDGTLWDHILQGFGYRFRSTVQDVHPDSNNIV